MGKAYPSDSTAGDGQRLYRAAPEEDLIRVERSTPLAEPDVPSMRAIPVRMPPAEPDLRTGDSS